MHGLILEVFQAFFGINQRQMVSFSYQ